MFGCRGLAGSAAAALANRRDDESWTRPGRSFQAGVTEFPGVNALNTSVPEMVSAAVRGRTPSPYPPGEHQDNPLVTCGYLQGNRHPAAGSTQSCSGLPENHS